MSNSRFGNFSFSVFDKEQALDLVKKEIAQDNFQKALQNGDPIVLDWLRHEEARRLTFRNWDGKYVSPWCLAFAGFFYTGRKDIVQCVFCLKTFKNWTNRASPINSHLQQSPDCPFVKNLPCGNEMDLMNHEVNMKCCTCFHPLERKHRSLNPLTPLHRKAKGILYMLAITTLATYIGLDCPRLVLATTPQLPEGFTKLDLQRGTVGILKAPVIIPEEFSSTVWHLELHDCGEAYKVLRNLINHWVDTSTGPQLAEVRKALLRLDHSPVEQILDSISTSGQQGKQPQQWCNRTKPMAFDAARVCQDIRDQVAPLRLLKSPGEITAPVLATMSVLITTFYELMQEVANFVNIMKEGQIPPSLQNLIDSKCAQVFSECKDPIAETTEELSTYGRILDVRRVWNNATRSKRTTATAQTIEFLMENPCISERNVYGKYHIYGLPYIGEDGETSEKMDIGGFDSITASFRKDGEQFELRDIEEKGLTCDQRDASYVTALCTKLPTELQHEQHFTISDRNLSTQGTIISHADPVEVYDIGESRYLVSTTIDAKTKLTCGNNTPQEFSMEGQYITKLEKDCQMTIEKYPSPIKGYQSRGSVKSFDAIKTLLPQWIHINVEEELAYWHSVIQILADYWPYMTIPSLVVLICTLTYCCVQRNVRLPTRPSRDTRRRIVREYVLKPRVTSL